LINADRGHIELDGYDVTGLPMYQRARLGIGYLPQEASIFRGLNVEDNIRSVLEVVEPDRRRREADLNALLEEFNIARVRKTPTITLSGGERRRAGCDPTAASSRSRREVIASTNLTPTRKSSARRCRRLSRSRGRL